MHRRPVLVGAIGVATTAARAPDLIFTGVVGAAANENAQTAHLLMSFCRRDGRWSELEAIG